MSSREGARTGETSHTRTPTSNKKTSKKGASRGEEKRGKVGGGGSQRRRGPQDPNWTTSSHDLPHLVVRASCATPERRQKAGQRRGGDR